MPLFRVITRSIFENAYLVDADTIEDARIASLDTSRFFQKHISETAEYVSEVCSGDARQDDYDIECEHLRKNGYE